MSKLFVAVTLFAASFGMTLTSAQATTQLSFSGSIGWSLKGDQITLTVPTVTNKTRGTSGTIRSIVAASRSAYPSTYYILAQRSLGQVGPNRSLPGRQFTVKASKPNISGTFQITVVMQEYTSSGWVDKAFRGFGSKNITRGVIGGSGAPSGGGGSGSGGGSGGGGSNPQQNLGYVTLGDSEMRSFTDGYAFNVHTLAPGVWPANKGQTPGRAHGGDWIRMFGLPRTNARSFLRTGYALVWDGGRPQIAWQAVRVNKGSRILMGFQWLWRDPSAYRVSPVPPMAAPAGWYRWQTTQF